MDYEQIKTKIKENKQNFVLGLCFVIVFIVGFGAGNYERQSRRDVYKPLTKNNYTTQPAKNPTGAGEGEVLGQATGTAATSSTTPASNCIVKGNISSSGKKIYHVQGGAFYKRVKPEECFDSEAQALAAGFIKSSR